MPISIINISTIACFRSYQHDMQQWEEKEQIGSWSTAEQLSPPLGVSSITYYTYSPQVISTSFLGVSYLYLIQTNKLHKHLRLLLRADKDLPKILASSNIHQLSECAIIYQWYKPASLISHIAFPCSIHYQIQSILPP